MRRSPRRGSGWNRSCPCLVSGLLWATLFSHGSLGAAVPCLPRDVVSSPRVSGVEQFLYDRLLSGSCVPSCTITLECAPVTHRAFLSWDTCYVWRVLSSLNPWFGFSRCCI